MSYQGSNGYNYWEQWILIFKKFSLEGKEFELRGIIGKPSKVVISNGMKKLLKTRHLGVIVQLCSLDVQTFKPCIPLNHQGIIDKNFKLFEYILRGLPPTRDHDHAIHLIPRSVPPNMRPYRQPYAQKSEIERMVEEMLEAGIIRPSQSSYSAPVVMVLTVFGAISKCCLHTLQFVCGYWHDSQNTVFWGGTFTRSCVLVQDRL